MSYTLAGNLRYALKAYSLAYVVDPKLVGAKIYSAKCLHKLGQRADAEQAYKEALEAFNKCQEKEKWQELLGHVKLFLEMEEE
jgi:tetratricopeptide (TPR) repeat protein